jgi:hypothetical protein
MAASSVFAGMIEAQAKRPQSVLNAAARLIISAWKSEDITLLLRDFHWLKIIGQIYFRLCLLAYRYLNGTAPLYPAENLRLVADVSSRRLRFTSSLALTVPATRRSIRQSCISNRCSSSVEFTASIRHHSTHIAELLLTSQDAVFCRVISQHAMNYLLYNVPAATSL